MKEIDPEKTNSNTKQASGCGCNPSDTYASVNVDNQNNPNCGCSFVSSRTADVQSGGGHPGTCSCKCTGDEHLAAPAQSSNSASHEGSL